MNNRNILIDNVIFGDPSDIYSNKIHKRLNYAKRDFGYKFDTLEDIQDFGKSGLRKIVLGEKTRLKIIYVLDDYGLHYDEEPPTEDKNFD